MPLTDNESVATSAVPLKTRGPCTAAILSAMPSMKGVVAQRYTALLILRGWWRADASLISPYVDTLGTLGTHDNGFRAHRRVLTVLHIGYSDMGEINPAVGNRAWHGRHARYAGFTKTDPVPVCPARPVW
jgi:hypothetical protein